jgi:hypothetical protein
VEKEISILFQLEEEREKPSSTCEKDDRGFVFSPANGYRTRPKTRELTH